MVILKRSRTSSIRTRKSILVHNFTFFFIQLCYNVDFPWRSSSSRSNSPRTADNSFSIIGSQSPFQAVPQPLPLLNLGRTVEQQGRALSPEMFRGDMTPERGRPRDLVREPIPNGPNEPPGTHDPVTPNSPRRAGSDLGSVSPRQVMSLSPISNNLGNPAGNGRPREFDLCKGDEDLPMWEPSNWVFMRERQVQRDLCMPDSLMEHLSLMRENNLRRLC